jgi:hypothetical protein
LPVLGRIVEIGSIVLVGFCVQVTAAGLVGGLKVGYSPALSGPEKTNECQCDQSKSQPDDTA